MTVLHYGAAAIAAQQQSFEKEQVFIRMSDGVHLASDVYLPAGDGTYPVVLVRTPYGKASMEWLGKALAEDEYGVVIQDVRGTQDSGGQFFPFVLEKRDGEETLDWIANQPWSDGRIGLWGVSYGAYAGFVLAETGRSSLCAMVQVSGWPELENFLSHGGAFHLMAHLRWFYSYAAGEQAPPEEEWEGIFRTVPLAAFFQGADAIQDLASAPFQYDKMGIPTLHVTGWYDYIYPNTLAAYDSLLGVGESGATQRLIVGPWAHNDMMNEVTKVGDEDFGPEAKWGMSEILEVTKSWFDAHLKGNANPPTGESPVTIFVMGENRWREFDSWPPPNVEYRCWYIDCDGEANGLEGSGRLSLEHPTGQEFDTYRFDPLDPVPTYGGSNSHFFPKTLGPRDQRDVETRQDVLVYTSEPLSRDVLVVGPIKVVLFASSEGKDTDFTAKVVEVRPDGYARNIEDGIIRASYRFLDESAIMQPGAVYEFEIDLGASAIKVEKGSRLRLEISSSNFPKYDRNPNTGVAPLEAVDFVTVTQKVYHSKTYPSHVVLPALPEE